MSSFNEHSLEMAIMELFEQQGYSYVNGETIHKELSEVLLRDDLKMYLMERYSKASCVVIDGRNGVDVLVDKIADTWKMKDSIVRPSVKDVIAEVALSRRLLERRFKLVTGQTLYQYISDLKIKRFAELLIDTDEQVVGIALSLGENDTKSISRRFKQIYGCSPHEWRERHQLKKPSL